MLRTLALLALVLAAGPVQAQVTILDEGTFSHSVNGLRVGREDFSIRAARGASPGAAFVAQANVLAGEYRRTLVLNTDSLGTPLRFQLEAREATEVVSTVVGERQRSVWLGRIMTDTRESAREFRLPDATFVAEPGVVHQLWFALQFGRGRPLVLLSPSGPREDEVLVREVAADSVRIGDRDVAARRWELRRRPSDELLWEVWTDAQGRILRARHAPSGLDALRDDPPAETAGR